MDLKDTKMNAIPRLKTDLNDFQEFNKITLKLIRNNRFNGNDRDLIQKEVIVLMKKAFDLGLETEY